MNDEVDNRDEQAGDEAAGPLGGERLAEARRALQISVVEVAKELHLDEQKVRALEKNEFDILGAPVFAKGHLKKYANLVGVSVEDILSDYYRLNREVSMPPVVSSRPRPRQELTPGPWIAVIVVIVLAVTAYWWFTRPAGPEPEAEQTLEPAPANEVPVEAPDEAEAAADDAAPEALPRVDPEPQPEPETTAVEAIEETASPGIIPGQMRLLLTYTGDCWTEITDASGRRLLFDLGKDGRTVELSGAEPFNVLFGNPGNVEVSVNGSAYELPPVTRPDRPMRLTISGS